MAKSQTSWFCSECGYESSRWLGRCPVCSAWNTMTESSRVTGHKAKASPSRARERWVSSDREDAIVSLAEVGTHDNVRFSSGVEVLDIVLGGGVVEGSLILLGGEPGIGKSSLVLQMLSGMKRPALYVSGEESARQIALRAQRFGINGEAIALLSSTNLDTIEAAIRERSPALVVIDSIQTLYAPDSAAATGSASQIKEVTQALSRLAKQENIAIVLIGHVTKDGQLAGPRVLEHMVDTVLYFEGDANSPYRIVRAFKNRFGATDELALFEMTDRGLRPLSGPGELFRLGRGVTVHGSSVAAVVEGTRPMLLEIQALVSPSAYATPLRTTQGIDRGRLTMLIAVIDKFVRLGLTNQDAYVNVAGGLRIQEPAADLAVVAALLSSAKETPLRCPFVVTGEVGLSGEIRRVSQIERRALEAERLGFHTMIVPGDNERDLRAVRRTTLNTIYYVNTISEAIDVLFGAS